MAEEWRLTIPAVLESVPEACEFVVRAAEAASLDERAVYYCQLAVDEWCTNIIEHGYREQSNHQHIELSCEVYRGTVAITIRDKGPAFNPMTLTDTVQHKTVEAIEPGGLGWMLIRKVMDSVQYEFKNGRNQLTMVKKSTAPEVEPSKSADVFPSRTLSGNVWVVTASGRLDTVGGRTLEATFTTQFEAGHHWLVVDMSNVNYISSGGLKVLISAWRKSQKLGGGLVLAGLAPKVRKVFEISGFDTLFTIAASVEDAVGNITS